MQVGHYRNIVKAEYGGNLRKDQQTDDLRHIGDCVQVEGNLVPYEVDLYPLEGNYVEPILAGEHFVANLKDALTRIMQQRSRAIFVAHGYWQAVLQCDDGSLVVFNPHEMKKWRLLAPELEPFMWHLAKQPTENRRRFGKDYFTYTVQVSR